MIIGFIKTMHTYIIGQPKRSVTAQSKRVTGFTYCFATTISRADMDWNGVCTVISECLSNVMQIQLNTIKDMEISLDISAERYTVRFNSPTDIAKDDYAAEITWLIQSIADGYEETVGNYPFKYVVDNSYIVTARATPLTIDEVERLAEE